MPRKWPYAPGTPCSRCRGPLPHARKHPLCRRCAKEYATEYRARPEVKARHVAAHRERVYGINPAEYAERLADQGGVCAVCGAVETSTRRGVVKGLAVDHDHVTGGIRGLLCQNCNTAIGLMGDSPARLIRAAAYLSGDRMDEGDPDQ